MQSVILDEKGLAAEARAVREDHTVGVGRDLDVGDDLVGLAADVDRDALGHR